MDAVLADANQAAARWGFWISMIIVVGVLTLLLLVLLAVARRWSQRQRRAIERDKQARRQARSTPRIDAWRAGSDRYVDRDKLPDDVPLGEYDSEPDTEQDPDTDQPSLFDNPPPDDASDFDGDEEDEEEEEDHDQPPYRGRTDFDEEPDEDPYGLFKDTPYQDPDDDEDEDDQVDDDDDDVDDDEDDDAFGR